MRVLAAAVLILTALAGVFFFTTTGVSSEGVRAVQPSIATPGGSVDERIDRLEAALARIAARIEALESRPVLTQSTAVQPGSGRTLLEADTQPLEETLRELAAALENPGQPPSPQLENLIVGVVEGREQRAEAERLEERRQAIEDRINERMLELRHELGLDERQAEEMRGLIVASQEKREALFDRMREGPVPDRRNMRDEMRTIRDEFNSEVQLVLAPAQYDRFLELERENSDFGWGRRGGPGGGGPGGGTPGREEGR